MKDFYYILGTDNNCPPGEIDAAYRKLTRKLQPNGEEPDYFLERRFNDITEAYQVLSDPTRRRKYDAEIKKGQQRRINYLKTNYINIAATLTLLFFTGLFAFYVTRAVNGGKTPKKAIKPQEVVQAAVQPVVLHKKKHRTKTTQVIAGTQYAAKIDTTTPAVRNLPKPVPLEIKPELINADDHAPVPNTAYIQANVTGVVSLHEQASYRSAVLTNIPNHSKVLVVEKGAAFCKVAFNSQTGYVPNWTITDH